MKQFVVQVKGRSNFSTVEQIFDDKVKAQAKRKYLMDNGYLVEWILHEGITLDEYYELSEAAVKAVYGE